jgi:membrane glycosyltransferase
MQYVNFLNLPGLKPVSRYQLVFAILMFIGSPAWIGLLLLGTALVAGAADLRDEISVWPGLALYLIVLVMWMSPKLATILHVLPDARARAAFGGMRLFALSIACEAVFFILLMPIMWFRHTLFLIGLLFGRQIGWVGQVRDDHSVPWPLAARALWPQTLMGVAVIAILAATHPAAIIFAFFIAGGLALSIPLAALTSSPQVGRWLTGLGIGCLPEESAPPTELVRLGLPALALQPGGRAC